ncbi:MAG TPA: ribosome maturation factor RimM [Nocardioidaceae bacterium]|nr:ribosome maturation factor RimM [Nocardioidaceae bacterium]
MGGTEVVVGRIGRAHGIRGEVAVEPRTDEPDRRFVVGASLDAEGRAGRTSLTVRSVRRHQSRLLVGFDQIADRDQAESLRGQVLVTSVDAAERPGDPEEFYDHQLVGLHVLTTEGRAAGEVTGVVHTAGQDLLRVRIPSGEEALVPFVAALVPEVDPVAGRVVVADRPGLLTALPDEPEQG